MKTRFARLPGLKSGRQSCRSRECSRQDMRGTGFEPEREMLARSARCAFLAGFKSGRQSCRSRTCSRQDMRGTGFEPADLYRTAPSTLRRWPSLATHARGVSLQPSVIRGAIKGLSFVDRPVGGPRFRASVPTVFPAEVVRARRPAAEQRAEVPKLRPKLESETRRPACVAERGVEVRTDSSPPYGEILDRRCRGRLQRRL